MIFEGKPGFAPVIVGLDALLLGQHQLGGVPGQEQRHVLPAGPGELAAGAERQRSVAAAGTAAGRASRTSRTTASGTDVTKNIPGMSWGPGMVPQVFVSQTPAELILLDGPAELQQIPGTSLSWVTNTESDLFFYTPTSTWYYLVSGRWFSCQRHEWALDLRHQQPARRLPQHPDGQPACRGAVVGARYARRRARRWPWRRCRTRPTSTSPRPP